MNFNWDKVPQDFYTNLGNSGLKISKIILGCMTFGQSSWEPWVMEDEEKIFEIMKKCYDVGIRTFDTADLYSNGYSEILVGKFIKKYNIPRDKIVILSKCYCPIDTEDPAFSLSSMSKYSGHEYVNSWGLSRKHIMDAAKAINERLGTYMDVFQIHRFDPSTPMEETMEALNDCVKAGYTTYIGASSMKTYQFVMFQSIAEKKGWAKFISMQSYYNLLYRHDEEELNAYCKETGVGLIPYSPIARGVLTRPVGSQTERGKTDVFNEMLGLNNLAEGDVKVVQAVEKIAKEKGVSMATIASAWVIQKGACPIVGMTKPERIDDFLEAAKITFTEEELKSMEETYASKYIPM